MADTKDKLGEAFGNLGMSDPAITLSQGIAAVGEKASSLYEQGKKKLRSLVGQPPSQRGDIYLPSKKEQAQQRSVAKRGLAQQRRMAGR